MTTLDNYNGNVGKVHRFYTVGYGKASMTSFIDKLKRSGIVAVVDTRQRPHSQFKPEFSKTNLKSWLERNGIHYIHVKELGVPKDVRVKERSEIWKWYDAHFAEWLGNNSIQGLFEHGAPIAFLCAEHNPEHCHRSRIAKKLGADGFIYEGDL